MNRILKPNSRVSHALLLLALGSTTYAQSGTIEFSDTAPPPSAQNRLEAKQKEESAKAERAEAEQLAELLRATMMLINTAEKSTTASGNSVDAAFAEWQSKTKTVDSSSGRNDYLKATLALVQSISASKGQGAPGEKTTTIVNSSKSFFETLLTRFDHVVIQHGADNCTLRYYPFSALVREQPSLDYKVINRYSRNIRILPISASGVVTDDGWVTAPSIDLREFSKAPYIQNYPVSLSSSVQTWTRNGAAF